MQVIKSISARECIRLYPKIKRRFFWLGKLWTQSFFVETVGNYNENTVREYVKNQLSEMDKLENKTRQLKIF